MCVASATFAVWTAAWLSGRAASDDVLDSLAVWGERHEVVAADTVADALQLPAWPQPPAPPAQLLATLRKCGARTATLALPAPGDVRGLGGPGPLVDAALDSGEATLFADIGIGLVPHTVAEGVLRWTVYPIPRNAPVEHVGISEAEHELTEAVRTSAATLAALDVARDRADAHDALKAHLSAIPRSAWPSGMPGRSLRVLQRATEIAGILELANADDPGGALSAGSAAQRAEALRPIAGAVRNARSAAVNEAVRVLTAPAEKYPR
ncbi:MAG: hypothetical protein GEU86_15835 [Actinophytocola sp.]|nr:hypothetical protein [Actinophytocola sp.]